MYAYDAIGLSVQSSYFLDNGFNGFGGGHLDNLYFRGNTVARCNNRHWTSGGADGAGSGLKVTASKYIRNEYNSYFDNYGMGAWYDISVMFSTFVGEVAARNSIHGLLFELCHACLVISCIAFDNLGVGVSQSGTTFTEFWNVTAFRNRDADFTIVDDDRTNTAGQPGASTTEYNLGATWTTSNAKLYTNIIEDTRDNLQPLLMVRDYSTVKKSYNVMLVASEYNSYQRVNVTAAYPFVALYTPNDVPETISSLMSVQVLGRELTSSLASTSSLNNIIALDYRRLNSQASATSQPISAAVATALSEATGLTRTAGEYIGRGAFTWAGL